MPRLSGLMEDFAQRFSFEPTKVASLARPMREAGLLTQGARGVNAPMATTMDAARLLIAMMLDTKIATVAADVELIGSFRPIDGQQFSDVFAPKTLDECLAGILEYTGRHEEQHLDGFVSYFRIKPYVGMAEVMIGYIREAEEGDDGDEDGLIERTKLVHFVHPDIDQPSLDLPESYWEAMKRFPTGFYQEPELRTRELIAIGQIVADREPLHWWPK